MQFNVGDRVLCTEGFCTSAFDGQLATVEAVRNSRMDRNIVLRVIFDSDPERPKEWYSRRFIHADPEIVNLSPICRKIRQMEKRFQTWQNKKKKKVVVTKLSYDTTTINNYW